MVAASSMPRLRTSPEFTTAWLSPVACEIETGRIWLVVDFWYNVAFRDTRLSNRPRSTPTSSPLVSCPTASCPKLVGIGVVADAGPAGAQLAVGQETALDAQRVREDESSADRRVEDGVVTLRQRRGPVIAAGHVHVEPVFVVEAGQPVQRVDLLLLLVERVGRLAIRVL